MIYVYPLQTVCSREYVLNACLVNICEACEETTDFFSQRSEEKEQVVTRLFFDYCRLTKRYTKV